MTEKTGKPTLTAAEPPKSYLIRDLDSPERCYIYTYSDGCLTIKEISEADYNALRERSTKARR